MESKKQTNASIKAGGLITSSSSVAADLNDHLVSAVLRAGPSSAQSALGSILACSPDAPAHALSPSDMPAASLFLNRLDSLQNGRGRRIPPQELSSSSTYATYNFDATKFGAITGLTGLTTDAIKFVLRNANTLPINPIEYYDTASTNGSNHSSDIRQKTAISSVAHHSASTSAVQTPFSIPGSSNSNSRSSAESKPMNDGDGGDKKPGGGGGGRHHDDHHHLADNNHIPIPPTFFPNHPMPYHGRLHPSGHDDGHHQHHHHHPSSAQATSTAAPPAIGIGEASEGSGPVVRVELASPAPAKVAQDQDEKEVEITTLHDLIAGGIAGSASVVVGQPFDTIKVRIQAGESALGGTAAKQSVASSVRSLFSGMLAPLCAAGLVNALVFSTYGASSRLWDDYYGINEEEEEQKSYSQELEGFKWKNYWCGCFAGFTQTFILCPTEHVKCRLQTQQAAATGTAAAGSVRYKGPYDAARDIYRTHGINGVFRGWSATALREIPAFGLYFSTYDMIKEYITAELERDVPDAVRGGAPSWTASAVAGGVSGCVTWTVVYPVDVVKTRIQTRPLDCKRGMLRVATDIVRENGWRHMFRGLGVTLVRAFPVNGIIFPVYEFSLLHLPGLMETSG